MIVCVETPNQLDILTSLLNTEDESGEHFHGDSFGVTKIQTLTSVGLHSSSDGKLEVLSLVLARLSVQLKVRYQKPLI